MLRSLSMSLCALMLWSGAAEAKPVTVSGTAYAIDGDTLVIRGRHIRLFGIDAFERDQMCARFACGVQAKSVLAGLTKAIIVTCVQQEIDGYGRMVATCRTSAIPDLGADMVRRGLAVAYRTYSQDYLDEESYAKAHRLGAWAYGFQSPLKWRRAHPRE